MSWLNAFRANVVKVVLELTRYLPNTLAMIFTFYAIFVFMFLGIKFVGDPTTAADNIRYVMVANSFWFLLMMGVSSMGWELSAEALRGTLEQLYMSTVPPFMILLFRMIATMLINTVLLALLITLSMLTTGQWLTVDVTTLVLVLPPTFLAVMGLGYAVAGLTIVYKQMNAVLQLLQFALMGIAFVPLTAVPLFELAPTAKGIDMIRQVMAAGTPLATFTALDWATLVGTGAFWFVLGLGVYLLFERRSMNRGLLGHY